jgi:hypothetical protein
MQQRDQPLRPREDRGGALCDGDKDSLECVAVSSIFLNKKKKKMINQNQTTDQEQP